MAKVRHLGTLSSPYSLQALRLLIPQGGPQALSLVIPSLRDRLQRETMASGNGSLLQIANSFVRTAGCALKLHYIPLIRASALQPWSAALVSDKAVLCICVSFNGRCVLIVETADNKQ